MAGSKKSSRAKKKAIQNMSMEKMMVLLAGADQAAKSWVESQPAGDFPRPLPATDGKIVIYRNHNAGLPFGVLAKDKDLVKMLPVAVTSMLAGGYIYLKSRNERRLLRMALALAIGGSLSNIADRFSRGYVVDYLCVNVGELKKVTFNLGDAYVFTGFMLMTLIETARALGIRRA